MIPVHQRDGQTVVKHIRVDMKLTVGQYRCQIINVPHSWNIEDSNFISQQQLSPLHTQAKLNTEQFPVLLDLSKRSDCSDKIQCVFERHDSNRILN